MQQVCATVGTARASAGPVCDRRNACAVFSGNSSSARACSRAAAGSCSAAASSHNSRRNLPFHADFERDRL